MSTTFRPYAPDQMLLLPADLRAWLPEGHLAHHVSDLVDGVDLTAFYAPYAGDGRRNAPYAPRMMVKVLLYAYATGVFSSRGIARKLEEDVAFRVLGAGNFPQHRTLCEFRRRHLSDFKELVAVVRLARFGKLSIDGTKVRANASKRKAMSDGRMAKEERRLRGEIEARLAAVRGRRGRGRAGGGGRADERSGAAGKRSGRRSRPSSGQRTTPAVGSRTKTGTRPCRMARRRRRATSDPESGIMKTSNDGFRSATTPGGGEVRPVASGDGERERPGWCAGASTRWRRRSASSRRRCWRTPATATSGTWRTWKREASTGMCPWAGRGRRPPRDPYPATSRMAGRGPRAAYAERKWLWLPTQACDDASLRGLAKVPTWCAWRTPSAWP